MLNVGGIVAFDDTDDEAVAKVCRYALTNRCYSLFAALHPPPSWKRRVYERMRATALGLLKLLRVPARYQRVLLSAEFLRSNHELGLRGSMAALRKEGEDREQTDQDELHPF